MTIQSILEKYKFSSGFAARGNDAGEVQRLSSGSVSLDKAIGGGLPKGMMTVVAGNQSSGKTTLCVSSAIQAQKRGKWVVWNDTEFKLDLVHAKRQGMDLDKIYTLTSTSIEEATDLLITILNDDPENTGLIIWDSFAQSFSARTLAKDNLDGAMASSEAAAFSRALPRLQAALHRANVPMLATNQWRTKGIGSPTGRTYRAQYGGNILNYAPAIIVNLIDVDIVRKLDVPIGQQTKFEVVKNHTAPPHSIGKFDIDFDHNTNKYGISLAGDLTLLGLDLGLIKKSGSWFSIEIGDETFKAQGLAGLKMELRERSDVINYLLTTIMGDDYVSIYHSVY
jgi:recombination protein RecA